MKQVRLGNCFTIIKGKKVKELDDKKDGSIRYIQIEDLRNDDNIKYCFPEDNYVIAKKDDIIIAWDGANAGTIGYGLEGAIGSTLAILRLSIEEEIYIPFIGRYMQSITKYLRDTCTGATIPHISKKVLQDIKIPLPPIQTQHIIANVLDKAQYLIDKRKKQIKECDRLIEGLFYDMFGDPATNPKGWSCRSFKSVARIATISADMDEIGEDDLYVGLEHIEKDTGKILEYVRAKDVDLKSDKFKFNEGMILYGKLRPYLNKVALIKQSGVCSTDILPILPNNDFINIYYLLYYMRDRYFVNSMTQRAIGANLPRVNKKVINSFRIMLPPLELQNEFARKVEKIEHQKQLLEKSLSLMEDNFNSLMQKAFRGELFS